MFEVVVRVRVCWQGYIYERELPVDDERFLVERAQQRPVEVDHFQVEVGHILGIRQP